MTADDEEMDKRDAHPEMAHESRQAGRTTGDRHEASSDRTRHSESIMLRIKPDRRRLVTCVDPAGERRAPLKRNAKTKTS